VRQLFDETQLDIVRRACIECWRGWGDGVAFNNLRNRWQQLSPECQRHYWLTSFRFADEGEKARQQARRAANQSWALGVELPFDEVKDKSKLSRLPRGSEPRFASVFIKWAEGMSDAV
jgi:hypothetical protein